MTASRRLPLQARPVLRWLLAGAVAVPLVLATGCASGPAVGEQQAVPTASDQTDIERRARVRLELASAYFGRGQLETALDETKLAIQVKPDLPDAYNLRGLVYAAMGEERLAEDSFNRALQLNPRDGSTQHNLAWFLCQRGQFAAAQARFDALLAQPQYRDVARSQLARGVCYGREGRFDLAEAALMRAYELEPANPATGLNLAEVLYRRQAWERAAFYIGRVNDTPDAVNAQTLWLAARIERKLGRESAVRVLGERLRQRFAQTPEAELFERGRFDD